MHASPASQILIYLFTCIWLFQSKQQWISRPILDTDIWSSPGIPEPCGFLLYWIMSLARSYSFSPFSPVIRHLANSFRCNLGLMEYSSSAPSIYVLGGVLCAVRIDDSACTRWTDDFWDKLLKYIDWLFCKRMQNNTQSLTLFILETLKSSYLKDMLAVYLRSLLNLIVKPHQVTERKK